MQFLRTLSKMYSVEDRQASHPAPMFKTLQLGIYQSRITNEPLSSLFNRVQSRQLVFGRTIPKVAAVLHTRPNLCLIQLKQLFRSEVPPDLREYSKFFSCHLCFGLDILPKVELGRKLHTKELQAVGQRDRYTSEGRSQVYSAPFSGKQTRLSFGSVERDQYRLLR